MPLPSPESLNSNESNAILQAVRLLQKQVRELQTRAAARTSMVNTSAAHVVVGTGDPFNIENPFTGTAIVYPAFADASGNYHIFGMNAGTLTWGANSDDGKFYAAAGVLVIDNSGIALNVSTSLSTAATYHFKNGVAQANIGGMGMYLSGGDQPILSIIADSDAIGGGKDAQIFIDAISDVGDFGTVKLRSKTEATVNGQLWVKDDITLRDGSNIIYDFELATGETSFNEQGADIDIRFEGDTDVNNFFSDASTDRIGIGTATPASKMHVFINSATTNALVSVLRVDVNSSGSVANGLGSMIEYGIEDSAGNTEIAGYLGIEWLDKTNGSEESQFDIGLETVGAAVKAAYINKWGMYNKYIPESHEMVKSQICDWILSTGTDGWDTVNITGTVAQIEDVASHHGILQFSQNGANTGYSARIATGGLFLLSGGEYLSGVFRLQNTTNCVYEFGLHDAIGSIAAPVDGAWINIAGTTLSGKTANNTTTSTTATTYTVSTATWYRMKVVVNSGATQVDFYLYSAAAALLWHDSLTTNIPTAAGRDAGIGFTGYKTTAGTVALFDLDWCAFGSENVIAR